MKGDGNEDGGQGSQTESSCRLFSRTELIQGVVSTGRQHGERRDWQGGAGSTNGWEVWCFPGPPRVNLLQWVPGRSPQYLPDSTNLPLGLHVTAGLWDCPLVGTDAAGVFFAGVQVGSGPLSPQKAGTPEVTSVSGRQRASAGFSTKGLPASCSHSLSGVTG